MAIPGRASRDGGITAQFFSDGEEGRVAEGRGRRKRPDPYRRWMQGGDYSGMNLNPFGLPKPIMTGVMVPVVGSVLPMKLATPESLGADE